MAERRTDRWAILDDVAQAIDDVQPGDEAFVAERLEQMAYYLRGLADTRRADKVRTLAAGQ